MQKSSIISAYDLQHAQRICRSCVSARPCLTESPVLADENTEGQDTAGT